MHAPSIAPTTTSIAPRFLVALLDAAGRAPEDLLSSCGIDRAALSDPEFAMRLAPFRELWARSAALEPAVGLRLLERFPPGQMHMLAHLALRSANVRAAIEDTCRFAKVTSAADQVVFAHHGELARLDYACAPDNPWMVEHYFSMIVVFLARATGRALPIRSVEFRGGAQAAPADYEARFGLAPRFEAARNVLSFDASALEWPLATSDDYLHAILERVAQSREAAVPTQAVTATASAALARSLLKGTTPSMQEIASACGLGVRALREALGREGTSFRRLLDEARRDLAREHLQRGLSVTETCYLLGFSEPAAFQHACRRWFGHAAGELRGTYRARTP
jgi:AraC-like DNA-binding protein